MATIWLTYAWADNGTGDVDFVAQEIQRSGVSVKLDRWNLGAGKRLWEQIEAFIADPQQCDAWVLYATQNSLGSEPCREEFAYALDRALGTRGSLFPVVGLFPSSVDKGLIPAGIKTRLYLSTTDPDWKERLRAAAEGKAPTIVAGIVTPYQLDVHRRTGTGPVRFSIEVRPRAGTWAPFAAATPLAEKDSVAPSIMCGPRSRVTDGGMLMNTGEGTSDDGKWFVMFAGNEATPTTSYYIHCSALPSRLAFGVQGGAPVFDVSL